MLGTLDPWRPALLPAERHRPAVKRIRSVSRNHPKRQALDLGNQILDRTSLRGAAPELVHLAACSSLRGTHSSFAHSGLACIGSLVLVSMIFFSLCMGCQDGEANAAGADLGVSRVDLGTRPPGFKIELDVELKELHGAAVLRSITSTCSCLDVKLWQGQRQVKEGGKTETGIPLRARILFRPKGQYASVADTIAFAFAYPKGRKTTRTVEIKGILDPTRSLVFESAGDLALVLPTSTLEAQIPLREPVPFTGVRFPKDTWLSVSPLEGAKTRSTACLELKLGPFETPQEKSFSLEIPLSGGGFQVLPVTLRVQTPERFEPEQLVLNLAEGATAERELRLIGNDLQGSMPHRIRWSSPTGPHPARIRVQLAPADPSKQDRKLQLKIQAIASGGMTQECHLDFLPRKNSPYWLSLPILIRIRTHAAKPEDPSQRTPSERQASKPASSQNPPASGIRSRLRLLPRPRPRHGRTEEPPQANRAWLLVRRPR